MTDWQPGESRMEEARIMAGDAVDWMKQRGCLVWALAGIAGVVLLGEFGPEAPVKDRAELVAEAAVAQAEAEAARVLKVSPVELRRAYDENEVAAQAKYGGHPLEVTGVVSAILLDVTDDPIVVFESGDRFNQVQAGFNKEAGAATAALKKGQTVTVRCERMAEVMGRPVLSACVLLP